MDHIPTILLHICKESRTFTLERYKPFLGSPCVDLPIYFDFEGDTLFFNINLEWKFMTDSSHEEREAEKKEVLRLAAAVDAMMNELAWHQSSGLNNWSVSSNGDEVPENDSSDHGTADDNGEQMELDTRATEILFSAMAEMAHLIAVSQVTIMKLRNMNFITTWTLFLAMAASLMAWKTLKATNQGMTTSATWIRSSVTVQLPIRQSRQIRTTKCIYVVVQRSHSL
jgi:hypothetical protein